MAILRDTTPLPYLLRGLQAESWNVYGAIRELVDNSLGAGRGDATRVEIRWDSRSRVLTVLDNGRGADDLSRLFQLGNTIGQIKNDIGMWGQGGTKALVWLASSVNVWTLRDGRVSYVAMDWDEVIKRNAFPQVDIEGYKSTPCG